MTNVETEYTPDVWGAPKSVNEKDLTLPSGQRCRIRELNMEDVLELDLIDLMDSFSGQIMTDGTAKVANEGVGTFMEFLKNKQKRETFMNTVDSVIPVVVVAPTVTAMPKEGRVLRKDKIYPSMISFNDKLAIFTEAFSGFGEVSSFRTEQEASVGAVEESESVQHEAE